MLFKFPIIVGNQQSRGYYIDGCPVFRKKNFIFFLLCLSETKQKSLAEDEDKKSPKMEKLNVEEKIRKIKKLKSVLKKLEIAL